jgi:hypothetical protein
MYAEEENELPVKNIEQGREEDNGKESAGLRTKKIEK